MKIANFIRNIGFLSVALLATIPAHAHRVSVWLDFGSGVGRFRSFDAGASPMRYSGWGAVLNTGATVEWNRCHAQIGVMGAAGILTNSVHTGTYDFGVDVRGEFLYKCYENPSRDLHLWAGGALHGVLDIRYFPQLMNASVGATMFGDLQAVGMVQYDFAPSTDGAHKLFSVYAKLSLPLVAYVGRPGFAYMDNYNSSLNLINTYLTDYEAFAMVIPGASITLGWKLNLPNGNKVGLSYDWDYLTTRNHGSYRFDRATHVIRLHFMFHLN